LKAVLAPFRSRVIKCPSAAHPSLEAAVAAARDRDVVLLTESVQLEAPITAPLFNLIIAAATRRRYGAAKKDERETICQPGQQYHLEDVTGPPYTQVSPRGEVLNIRINDRHDDTPQPQAVFFRVRTTTLLALAFNDFARRKGVDAASVEFRFDGERIRGDQTVADAGLADGAQINATWTDNEVMVTVNAEAFPRKVEGTVAVPLPAITASGSAVKLSLYGIAWVGHRGGVVNTPPELAADDGNGLQVHDEHSQSVVFAGVHALDGATVYVENCWFADQTVALKVTDGAWLAAVDVTFNRSVYGVLVEGGGTARTDVGGELFRKGGGTVCGVINCLFNGDHYHAIQVTDGARAEVRWCHMDNCLIAGMGVDGPHTFLAVDIEKGPSRTTYMSRARTVAEGGEYWPMRFALRQGGTIRGLAREALKYGWMTNAHTTAEPDSDSSFEDRLRALAADETFKVHCPEDGEFGCMFRKGPEHEKTDRYGKKFYWG